MPKRKLTTKDQPDAKKQRVSKTVAAEIEDKPVVEPSSTTTPQKSLSSLIKEPSWSLQLQDLFKSDNFKNIEQYLNNEWSSGKKTYPPKDLIFEAFNKTPFNKVKVVLLGQDPYHDDGQVNTINLLVKYYIIRFFRLMD